VSINVPPEEQATQATLRSWSGPGGREGEELRREALALKRAEGLLARGHRMLDLEKLEVAGRFIVDTESHELWLLATGEPREGRPPEHAFGITAAPDFGIRWYEPAGVTIDEVVEQDRRSVELAKKAAAEAEAERRKRRKSPPARVITFADLHPKLGPGPLSLRAAVERIENLGGVVTVADGAVFVHGTPGESLKELAAFVHAAEATIVSAADGRSGAVDPARLPEVELTPNGKPLAKGMLGRAAEEPWS
jgi:hypothetical protein